MLTIMLAGEVFFLEPNKVFQNVLPSAVLQTDFSSIKKKKPTVNSFTDRIEVVCVTDG